LSSKKEEIKEEIKKPAKKPSKENSLTSSRRALSKSYNSPKTADEKSESGISKEGLVKMCNQGFFSSENREENVDFEIIGDLTYFNEKSSNLLKFLLGNFGNLKNFFRGIISGNVNRTNRYLTFFYLDFIWKIMLFLMILSYFITIPLQLGFGINFIGGELRKYAIFSLICFFLEFLFENLKRKTKRKKSFCHKIQFILNILSIFYILHCIFFFESSFYDNFAYFFYLSKCRNITKNVKTFRVHFLSSRFYFFLITFSKILLISHIYACFWHYLAFFSPTDEENWLKTKGILNENWYMRYLDSLYFIASIMTSNGTPDKMLLNSKEKTFSLVVCYSSLMFYLYSIVTLVTMSQKDDNSNYEETSISLNNYLNENKVNDLLASKAKLYLKSIFNENKKLKSTQDILKILPNSLKSELIQNSNVLFLERIPFLKKHFSTQTLLKLAGAMKEHQYFPNEMIKEQENNKLDPCLFAVKKGQVLAFLNPLKKHSNYIKKMLPNDFFNEMSFFITNKNNEMSFKSMGFSLIFSLKKSEFLQVLKENKDDYESYCKLRDQFMIYRDFHNESLKCLVCAENMHYFAMECPLINLKIDKSLIIRRILDTSPQKRCDFKRKHRVFNRNALKLTKQLQSISLSFENAHEYTDPRKTIEDDNFYIESMSDLENEKNKEIDSSKLRIFF